MELDEFITTTLLSIKNGLRGANLEISKRAGKVLGTDDTIQYEIDRDDKGIKFDIAVTVSSDSKSSGGGKIQVAVLGLGGEKTSSSTEERISRISFEVSAFKSVN